MTLLNGAHEKADDPAVIGEATDRLRLVNAAIRRLAPEYREALVLHAMGGLSYKEIGEILDCPVGTVASLRILRSASLSSTIRSIS